MSDYKREQGFEWVGDFRREQLKKSTRNPGLASLLSFFAMGMGQIYAGHIDKGIIYFVINIFSIFCGYSIYSEGFIYYWLVGYMTTNGLLILCYVASLAYMLLWIYNIKDAYYLALFSSFRDWFEIERVLLPSMGVPEEKLISRKNGSEGLFLQDDKQIEKSVKNISFQASVVDGSEDISDDSSVISVTASSASLPVEKKGNATKQNAVEGYKTTEEISDSNTDELVYMNYSCWNFLRFLPVVVAFVGLGACYISNYSLNEDILQLSRDFYISNVKKSQKYTVVENADGGFSGSGAVEISKGSDSQKEEKSYPIMMTGKQIESYIDLRMKDILASKEKALESRITVARYSDDNGGEASLPESSEAVGMVEENMSDNGVVFIQGHKEAKIIKKTSTDDNTLDEIDSNSKVLYEAPNFDVDVVLEDEKKITEIRQSVTDKKIGSPNAEKIDLSHLEPDETKENIEENEVRENLETADLKAGAEFDGSDRKSIDRKGERPVVAYKETPAIRTALEKIKERGADEFYKGNWESALPFYFELLKYRRNAESFEMVGIIFEKMDKLQDAYDAYKNAYDLGLKTRYNITRLGLLGEKLGLYEEAQKFLEKAIELNPKRADIVLCYARCLDKLGESTSAVQVLSVLKENTSSYAIKKAVEKEYLRLFNANKEEDSQKKIEEAVVSSIKNKK